MTITAELADGTRLEFEDGTDPNVVDAIVKRHIAQSSAEGVKSTLADVAKSAAYSVPKAVAGFFGAPKDVQSLADLGRGKLEQYLPEWMRNIDQVTSRLPLPGSLASAIASRMPGSQDIRGAVEKATEGVPVIGGKWPDPVTGWGKAADVAGQTATSMGRNLFTQPGKAASLVAGITGGTEAGGYLSGDSPWGRMLGGLVGGGIPAASQAYIGKPGRLLKRALADVTPEEITAARAIEEEAAKRGIKLAGTESLNRGEQFASAIAAHPAGYDKVAAMFAGRVPAVKQAVRSELLDQMGPQAAPLENAARAQNAATRYISDAEKTRTAVADRYYTAARDDVVDVLPAYMKAQDELTRYPVGMFPAENKAISDIIAKLAQPEATNAGLLDRLYQTVRNASEKPAIAASAEQKAVAKELGGIRDILGEVSATSPNIAAGRRKYQAISENVINPLYASPIGRMAGKSGFNPAEESPLARVQGTISDQTTARPETIRNLHQQLNGTDPKAFQGVAQTWIENALDKSSRDILSGPSWTAGAKLANSIAGSDIQKANFREVMRGVAEANGKNPDDVVKGAETLLEVLRRTGRTPGIGSQTQPRGELSEEMGRTLVGSTLSTISLTPTRPLARVWDKWIQNRRYMNLAEALTSDKSVDALVKLARLEPNGLTANYYVASLLGLDRAATAP